MFHNLTGRHWGLVPLLGYDQDANLWWWSADGTYYISAAPGVPITLDGGANCNPSGRLFNGQHYYTVSGGYLWHDGSQWVISAALGCKTEEYSETIDSVTTWHGDAWWSCGPLAGTYTARGSGKTTGAAKTVAMGTVAGWQSSTQTGVYTPNTGVAGNKYAGWRRFRDAAHKDTPYILTENYKCTYTDPPVYDNYIEEYSYSTIAVTESTRYIPGAYNWADPVYTYTQHIPKNDWYITTRNVLFEESCDTLNGFPVFVGDNGKFLWNDGADWIISDAVGTKNSAVGYWRGAAIPGVLDRVWTAPNPMSTPPVMDIDGNAYNLAADDVYGESVKMSSQLMAQVAEWL